jgi:hypothetical protein
MSVEFPALKYTFFGKQVNFIFVTDGKYLALYYAHRWDVPVIYFANVSCNSTKLPYNWSHSVVYNTWSLSNIGIGIFTYNKVRKCRLLLHHRT